MTDGGGSALGADEGTGEYNYKFITREQIRRINPVVLDLKSNKFQIRLPLLQNIKPVELIFSQSVQLDAKYQVRVMMLSVQMFGLTVLFGRTRAAGNDKILNSGMGEPNFHFHSALVTRLQHQGM